MVKFLYHTTWTIVFLFFAPVVLLLRNERLLKRLAFNLPLGSLGENNIWVHALSVGEVISALPLVKALNRNYPDMGIVFTVTTVKGMALAREVLGREVKALLPMPIDSWLCFRRLVRHIHPSIFLLIETDVWPGLIGYLKSRGIKTILVNGRISPRTFRLYKRFSFFIQKMYQPLELCLMQSDLDRHRLLQTGIEPSRKVITVGNIKFDREWSAMDKEEKKNLAGSLGFGSEDNIWVAGSTHPGEEKILLNVHNKLRSSFPALCFIIAPRKIEQSDEIMREAQDMGLTVALKSELPKNGGHHDVLVLNTIGELGRIYGLSKVSFVGGSLVPFGGHNLLEPASFGCPVVFGYHTYNFMQMSDSLEAAGGGQRVSSGEQLYAVVSKLMGDTEMRHRMGVKAKEFVERNRGALRRVLRYIGENINGSGGCH